MKFNCSKIPLIFILAFFLIVTSLKAQTNAHHNHQFNNRIFIISVGTEIGLANKNSPFNYSLGLDFTAQYILSQQLVLTASGGYSRLLTKDTSPLADYNFLPLTIGAKIFVVNNFYLLGNSGAGFPIQKGSKISFIFSGGLGCEINTEIDLSLKFTGYQQPISSSTYQPTNGMFIFRFAYNF